MNKITTTEMECLVARFLNARVNLIVPNVSWGMGLHECDLLVCTKAGYLWEVEIKVSKADLKKDAEKRHEHRHHNIKHLYFAIPTYLVDCIEHIPARAGIITVAPAGEKQWGRVKQLRAPETNRAATPIDHNARYTLARLGAMRIWGLKDNLLKAKATASFGGLRHMKITAEVFADHQHGPGVTVRVGDVSVSVYLADETGTVMKPDGHHGIEVTGPWAVVRDQLGVITETRRG